MVVVPTIVVDESPLQQYCRGAVTVLDSCRRGRGRVMRTAVGRCTGRRTIPNIYNSRGMD